MWRRLLVLFLAFTLRALAAAADAAFELAAGDAAETLKQFATQAQREILFPVDSVAGIRTHAVRGKLAPRDALDRMIEQTELTYIEDTKTGAFVIKRAPRTGRLPVTHSPPADRGTP